MTIFSGWLIDEAVIGGGKQALFAAQFEIDQCSSTANLSEMIYRAATGRPASRSEATTSPRFIVPPPFSSCPFQACDTLTLRPRKQEQAWAFSNGRCFPMNSDVQPKGSITCGMLLLEMLRDRGAGEIFGIPGDFVLPFFKIIEESEILPLYTLSHEPGVGFAADAAARYKSGISVAAVTYGAGALNMVNSIAGAYAEKSPVVVVSGAPGLAERERGLLLHHQVQSLDSPMKIFSEITCAQARIDDPARAALEIDRVLAAAIRYSQPVYIELPRDMVNAEIPDDAAVVRQPSVRSSTDPGAVDACAVEVLERLRNASQPVLMAGIEVRRYGAEARVAKLAAGLDIPVVTSFMGRGLLAHADPPPRGVYMGAAGDREITELVEGSDALLLLGVIPSDTNFGVAENPIDLTKAIHVADRSVRLGYHRYASIPLLALVENMERRVGGGVNVPAMRRVSSAPGMPKEDGPLSPGDIAVAVNVLFAQNDDGPMPIAADTGDCLFTAMGVDHTALVAPGYYASMGFGVPAGIGLQATAGIRPLVMVGDGAFQMTGWELGNCRRYGFDPIVLLFNNMSWGMLQAFQPESEFNKLEEWHFADMASSMGGRGERVRTRRELQSALDRAVKARGQFYLIEIMLGAEQISPALNRFVDAAKKGSGMKS